MCSLNAPQSMEPRCKRCNMHIIQYQHSSTLMSVVSRTLKATDIEVHYNQNKAAKFKVRRYLVDHSRSLWLLSLLLCCSSWHTNFNDPILKWQEIN